MASAALFDLLPDFGTRAPRVSQSQAAPENKTEASAPRADIGTLIAEAVAQAEATLGERAERLGIQRSTVQRALERIERLAATPDAGDGARRAPGTDRTTPAARSRTSPGPAGMGRPLA